MSAPTLFVLAADLTKMQVLASLDESDVGRIRPGQAVRFRVDAFPTEEFIGNVTQVRLQPTTVQNVVTYQTVIDVPNPELKLKPGMTANVNIEIARRADVMRVPNTALRFRPTPEIFAALGQTPPPGGDGRRRGDVAPARVPTRATLNRLSRPSRRRSSRRQQQRPGDAAPRRSAQQRPSTREAASARAGLPQGEGSAPQMAAGGDGARRRAPRRTRQFRGTDGEHDARRARAIHGTHARARLHSARRRARRRRARTAAAGARAHERRRQGQAAATGRASCGHVERDDVRCAVRTADPAGIVRTGLAECRQQAAARAAAPRNHRRPADRADSGDRRRH